MLLWQVDFRAASLARAKTGNRIAARIAMIAMTTKSSMSVKPLFFLQALNYLLLEILFTCASGTTPRSTTNR